MPFWPFSQKSLLFTVAAPNQNLEMRAMTAFRAKRYREAERLCQEVIAEAGKEGRQYARNILGGVYEHEERLDEAIAVYETNVSERAIFPHPYQRLAILYRRQKQPEQERRVLTAALSALPLDAHRWFTERLRKMK
jgi:tetratricopeptide (TPR) repeat protein